jgi:thymidylate synthase
MLHEETQYIQLLNEVIHNGCRESGRNGNVRSVFGRSMRFSLKDGTLPLLTTKKVAWKSCAKELFWFLSGSTSNTVLQSQGVHIWDGNATREYLDSRGLAHYEENELGPVYGYQWRHFGAKYEDGKATEPGVDQIQEIIDTLRDPEKRTSRRIILSAWNPPQLPEMALPPCHVMAQFNVRENKYLSCAMYQRSCDIGLGVPFNIASYSLLTHLLAKHTGLVADEFVYFMGNVHAYEDHVESLRTQVDRQPFEFPRIHILGEKANIEDYTVDDVVFDTPYSCHPAIYMKMVV